MSDALLTVALVGNPNCGKTTLFNALTGECRYVGNWPGVTVERAEGAYRHEGREVWVVDLPGLYSLTPFTPDEAISADFLKGGAADVVVNVVDASNLERSLYLTTQLTETGRPLIVALNMTDLAAARGMVVDAEALARRLGCPVIPMAAWKGEGVEALRRAILAATAGPPARPVLPPERREEAGRYGFARETARQVVRQSAEAPVLFSERVDHVVLSRLYGIPLFLAVMFAVFWVTVRASEPFMGLIDEGLGRLLVEGGRARLETLGAPEWVRLLLADGVGAGLRAVATFLPPIFFIFICLALLENSGYMARGAFVMDRVLRRMGLPGRAFLPLLVGFGCNVPGILATRTLPERRERLLTLLLNPFMSCSARLPVYTVFAMALFPRSANLIVFSLYFVGILVAIGSGLLLGRTILQGEVSTTVMELPEYQMPDLRAVLRHAWENVKGFMVRGGIWIVSAITVLSLANGLRLPAGDSPLERLGKGLLPVLRPLGITDENWPASVGLITGLFAKESVVGTLDALYSQKDRAGAEETAAATGDDEEEGPSPRLMESLRRHFHSRVSAYAYLLFVLLYSPCIAALAAIRREAGIGWMWFSFLYQTVLAWTLAMLFYQLATAASDPPRALLAVGSGLVILGLLMVGLYVWGRRRSAR